MHRGFRWDVSVYIYIRGSDGGETLTDESG